jgi:hypothetical protein
MFMKQSSFRIAGGNAYFSRVRVSEQWKERRKEKVVCVYLSLPPSLVILIYKCRYELNL